MIRFVLRQLGWWILAAAFIVLVYDGTRSIASSQLLVTPVRDLWNDISATSLPIVERHVATWLWNPFIVTVLTAPAALVFAVIGAALMLVGRKKKPLIGYAR